MKTHSPAVTLSDARPSSNLASRVGVLTYGILCYAIGVTGLCCPLGQLVASALLPRGNAWAPALRRLDSYLVAAPLWLVLVRELPTNVG